MKAILIKLNFYVFLLVTIALLVTLVITGDFTHQNNLKPAYFALLTVIIVSNCINSFLLVATKQTL